MKKTKKDKYFEDWIILPSLEPSPFDKYIDALQEQADNDAKIILDYIKALNKTKKTNPHPRKTIDFLR